MSETTTLRSNATHQLADIELHDVATCAGVVAVQCLPPHQRRVTVFAQPGVLAQGDRVHDRGVTMIVCGRAPWAEHMASQRTGMHFVGGDADGANEASAAIAQHDREIAAGREAWTLRRLIAGRIR